MEEMRDVTPATAAVTKPQPPKPPAPPAPPSAKVIEAEPDQIAESEFNLGDFLDQIETALAGAKDEADVEELWTEFDAPAVLETEGHADMIDAAYAIRDRRLSALSTVSAG